MSFIISKRVCRISLTNKLYFTFSRRVSHCRGDVVIGVVVGQELVIPLDQGQREQDYDNRE